MSAASTPSHPPVTTAKALGASIQAARARAGLNQSELARRAGITRSYVSQVERGLKIPAIGTLTTLADTLKTDMAALLGTPHPAARRPLPMHPGPRIAALRQERGWTLVELAERSGVAKSSIARIEAGESYGRPGSVSRLAKAFDVSLEMLYPSSEPAAPEAEGDSSAEAERFDPAYQPLAASLADIMDRQCLTRAELSRRSGVHNTQISNFLNQRRGLRLPALVKLAAAVNATFEFVGPIEPPAPDPAWTVAPGPWGERHTHVELGLVVEVTRDSAGRVVHVYTRPLGTLTLDGAARATDELAKRVRSL